MICFDMTIEHKGIRYRLQVEQVYMGDSLNRYLVKAGEKEILLEDRFTEKKSDRRWKIRSLNWQISDPKLATEFLMKIEDQIEYELKKYQV